VITIDTDPRKQTMHTTNPADPLALLAALAPFFSPSPLMRAVSSDGASATWHTRNPDGSRELHTETPSNFDWDGATVPARLFIIVYDQAGDGDRRKTKAKVPPGFREAVAAWRAAHVGSVVDRAIFAAAPASFSPFAPAGSAGMPDGTWGSWHKVVVGVSEPSRLATARYVEIG
jgi:hypothetical protein